MSTFDFASNLVRIRMSIFLSLRKHDILHHKNITLSNLFPSFKFVHQSTLLCPKELLIIHEVFTLFLHSTCVNSTTNKINIIVSRSPINVSKLTLDFLQLTSNLFKSYIIWFSLNMVCIRNSTVSSNYLRCLNHGCNNKRSTVV